MSRRGRVVRATGETRVEAAWAVVEAVLQDHNRAHAYPPGSWGPEEADTLIAPHGRWHNPVLGPVPGP